MAERKEKHFIPELDNTQPMTPGQCMLKLKTVKTDRGLWSYAGVSWAHDGFETFAMGSDYQRTFARSGREVRATQANVDRQHRAAFDGKLEEIKAEIVAYYAAKKERVA